MKGKLALFVLLVLIAVALWFLGVRVREAAPSDENFVAFYRAAQSVRQRVPVYAPEKAGPRTPARVSTPAGEPETEAPAVETDADAKETARSAPAPVRFGYAPYLAYILLPLAFFEDLSAAAFAWYWFNVALVVIALLLSAFTLTGRFIPSKGILLIPAFAAAPFLAYLFTCASASMLALVFVLVALALFRRKADVAAGLVSSVAFFSPFGIAVGAYWVIKRAWSAVVPFLIGAAVLLFLLPIISLGPAGALDEMSGYYKHTVAPYFSLRAKSAPLEEPENQSLWAVLMRHTTEISEYSSRAGGHVRNTFNINITRWTSDYMAVVLVVMGSAFLLVSFFSVWRRLIERDLAIVGIEGALVILAVLILSLDTHFNTMAAVIFPLAAVVCVIQNTDMKRLVHHLNYVGLILAAAFFYMALDPRFGALGTALGGVVVLWIALLAGIYRFRPRMVRGRASTSLRRREEAAKPIDLVEIKSDAEKGPVKGKGLLPLPEFTKRRTEGRVMTAREDREIPPVDHVETEHEGDERKDSPDDVEETDSPF